MKKNKFIFRLILILLPLLCALALGIYSQISFSEVYSTLNSPEIIDIALNSYDDAMEMMERAEYFKDIRNISFICSAVLIVCVTMLVVFYVKGDAIVSKLKTLSAKKDKGGEKAEKKKRVSYVSAKKVVVPVVDEGSGEKGYCRNCGKFYESLPKFCGECGETTT